MLSSAHTACRLRIKPLLAALAAAFPLAVLAESPPATDSSWQEVVVTGSPMATPLVVEADLKVPRQPLPAHDGADYLKTVPGFSVIRKGGTDGDPVLRGMSGSRLNVLTDGQNVLGGCNFRMDAPTAYIFPEAYDKLTVVKGPQTVAYGGGNSAGVVMFDRDPVVFETPGYQVHASALAGSFARQDEVVDARFGNRHAYGQATVTNSQSDDYRDGDGVAVHSEYHRYSLNAAVGWTPDRDSRLELSGVHSDGEAAYADRGMDGTKFERTGAALTIERKNLGPVVQAVDATVYHSAVDHVMDDQELRTPGSMGYANLTRDTSGGRLAVSLVPDATSTVKLGLDTQRNRHASRSAPPNGVYGEYVPDAVFTQHGVFAEVRYQTTDKQRLIGGLRADVWRVSDQRSTIKNTMMSAVANPTAGESRTETLSSAFLRYERQVGPGDSTGYVGLGRTERFPDYWEMIAKQGSRSISAFHLAPEKTTQLDLGVISRQGPFNLTASAFYGQIRDYILVDYSLRGMTMAAMWTASTGASRNVDATTYGGELTAGVAVSSFWKLNAAVAYVRGHNETDDRPLAQMPPLETRLGANYDDKVLSFGLLVRLVGSQDRFDKDQGNIVGKDIGRSENATVVSLNAGWRPGKSSLITAGVDNLFNRTYAEFVSRASGNGMGGAIPGYSQTTRVNEPGRTLWLKASLSFD